MSVPQQHTHERLSVSARSAAHWSADAGSAHRCISYPPPPVAAFGLTRCAWPVQWLAPPLRAAPGGPTPGLLESRFELPSSPKHRTGLERCSTPTIRSAQRNSCTLRSRSRSTGHLCRSERSPETTVHRVWTSIRFSAANTKISMDIDQYWKPQCLCVGWACP